MKKFLGKTKEDLRYWYNELPPDEAYNFLVNINGVIKIPF
jgi:hypothetical protein